MWALLIKAWPIVSMALRAIPAIAGMFKKTPAEKRAKRIDKDKDKYNDAKKNMRDSFKSK